MGLFDFIKGSESKVQSWTKGDGAERPHNPMTPEVGLVTHLKADHEEILGLIREIRTYAADKKFDDAIVVIRKLSATIKTHLTRENSRLYKYMEFEAEHDRENGEAIRELLTESKTTGKELLAFCDAFVVPLNEHLSTQQEQDLHGRVLAIEQVFLRRAGREETVLFPLYPTVI